MPPPLSAKLPRSAPAAFVALLLLLAGLPAGAAPPGEEDPSAGAESAALAGARQRLREAEARFGDRSLETARACDELVSALRAEWKFAEEETWNAARRALGIKEALLPRDDPELARSLINLAGQEKDARNFPAARDHAERALRIQERALGRDHADLAPTLRLLSALVAALGEYDDALALGMRALAIFEREQGGSAPEVGRSLSELAGLQRRRGDYNAALDLAERALRIREAELGPDHVDVARSLGTLATLRFFTGDHDGAHAAALRTKDILERELGPDHVMVALALDILAMVTGDPEESRRGWERSIAILEKNLGPDHPQLANAHNNLGLHLLRIGKVDEAVPHLETALRLQRTAYGEDHPDLAMYQVNVARGFLTAGDAVRALRLLESSLEILEESEGTDNPTLSICLDWLARTRRRTGDAAGAFRDALRSESIARSQFVATARGMAERDALDFARSRPRGLDVALTLAAEAGAPDAPPDRAWDATIRSRALVLDEVAGRRQAAGRLDSLRTRWERATEKYAVLAVGGAADRATVVAAEKSWRTTEKELAQAITESFEASHDDSGLDEVWAALPARSALVAFVLFRLAGPSEQGAPAREVERYLAFSLAGRNAPVRATIVGEAAVIDSLVGAVRDLSRRGVPEEDFRAAADALRQRVWDPLEIGDAETVFVVPDGSLALVNLATLPAADGDGYLVEEPFVIHHLSAERDLLAKEPPPGRGLLALGGADHDADVLLAAATAPPDARRATFRGGHSACSDLAEIRFEDLPGARIEVDRIGSLWREARDEEVVVLTGPAAREGELKRRAPGRRVVHIAAHGFFLGPDCREEEGTRGVTGMAPLRRPGEASAFPLLSVTSATLAGDNPLVTSGLALAGANGRGSTGPGEEDGILTAEEIAAVDLSGVEWAVLSGCDTGRGDVLRGEGVTGLRRAFRTAGARTLIMSLWSVSDEETVDWMTELYRARFAEGLSTAEAVRAASLRGLRDARARGESTHPFTWGAFVAAGDWR